MSEEPLTLWYVLHKLFDTAMYYFATRYLVTRWWNWRLARIELHNQATEAAVRLGASIPEWTGNHETGTRR